MSGIKQIQTDFSKKFSQYDEVYTQVKQQKTKDSKHRVASMEKKLKSVKTQGLIKFLPHKLILKIFKFLNVIDLFIITRVCADWKRIVDTDPNIFKIVDLVSIPKKVNSLNLIKIMGKGKNLKRLCFPESASYSDTTFLLMCVTDSLKYLQINNLNIDFSSVFTNVMPNIEDLDLRNKTNRKKLFDDNELKAITKTCPNLKNLFLNNGPIKDASLIILLSFFTNLKKLHLLNCDYLTNEIFRPLSKYCQSLEELAVGGNATEYNNYYSIEGIEVLCLGKFELQSVIFEYCAHIGDKAIGLLSYRFRDSLKSLSVVRNCYEKCSKISDEGIKYLRRSPNIERLTINYTRKFRDQVHLHLAEFFKNLTYLNLRNCPLQEDLSVLKTGCPKLEEVNLSGDSWVRSSALIGLSKHENLKILHLGHFEHSDKQCDENLKEYPPKGMFIEALFKRQDSFPKLHTLFLEQECSLTYWLDIRINKARARLSLRYTPSENLLTKS